MAAARMPPSQQSSNDAAPDLDWKFVQSFGDDNSSEDDLVTAVEFDHTGQFLAVGDKAGRICVFECIQPDAKSGGRKLLEYQYYTEFQSHEPEFDCLKSLEIEEKINMIEWPKMQHGNGRYMLATNDKTVKFWKIHQKRLYSPPAERDDDDMSVNLGPLEVEEEVVTHTEKRVFGNAHQYHINSISMNSDGETFLSADDLRINVWNIAVNTESYNVVDVKPANLEDLTEVITSARFHPISCNLLMYSSSRGGIQLADMRDAALCDQHTKQFKMEEDATTKSFFSEIISSISDARFTADGRFIISRDYLTVKKWDLRQEREPVSITPVHDGLKTRLGELYENDCIFDKFQVEASADGSLFVSGSYNNHFVINDGESSVTIEAELDAPKKKKKKPKKGKREKNEEETTDIGNLDFQKKVLHVAWHPTRNAVAIAGMNKLYIYEAAAAKRHSHR